MRIIVGCGFWCTSEWCTSHWAPYGDNDRGNTPNTTKKEEESEMSSDLVAMDSCFGLVRPHEHGTAKIPQLYAFLIIYIHSVGTVSSWFSCAVLMSKQLSKAAKSEIICFSSSFFFWKIGRITSIVVVVLRPSVAPFFFVSTLALRHLRHLLFSTLALRQHLLFYMENCGHRRDNF